MPDLGLRRPGDVRPEALREHGVDYQELVLPDEIHGFLRHASWLRVYAAAAAFLDAKLAVSSRIDEAQGGNPHDD